MFGRNTIGLVQHLPPAVARCGFGRQHPQTFGGKGVVGIGGGGRKQEIRLLVALGLRAVAELPVLNQPLFKENFPRM
ncbi:hypothetical protein D3C72_1910900 [compost metagenome]